MAITAGKEIRKIEDEFNRSFNAAHGIQDNAERSAAYQAARDARHAALRKIAADRRNRYWAEARFRLPEDQKKDEADVLVLVNIPNSTNFVLDIEKLAEQCGGRRGTSYHHRDKQSIEVSFPTQSGARDFIGILPEWAAAAI